MANMSAIRIGQSPLVYFQNVAKNVNFETQDCEHFPGEAGISQHFLRKCIQLMTLRMRIFVKSRPTDDLNNYNIKHIFKFVEQSTRLDRENLFG